MNTTRAVHQCVSWPVFITTIVSLMVIGGAVGGAFLAAHENGTHRGSVTQKEFDRALKWLERIDTKVDKLLDESK